MPETIELIKAKNLIMSQENEFSLKEIYDLAMQKRIDITAVNIILRELYTQGVIKLISENKLESERNYKPETFKINNIMYKAL